MESRIAKEFHWEMGHRLPFHQGGCQNIHGHSYTMRVEIIGTIDPATGMVIEHPEALYGKNQESQAASDIDGETIANAKFTYSQFTEQDSKVFYLLLE